MKPFGEQPFNGIRIGAFFVQRYGKRWLCKWTHAYPLTREWTQWGKKGRSFVTPFLQFNWEKGARVYLTWPFAVCMGRFSRA